MNGYILLEKDNKTMRAELLECLDVLESEYLHRISRIQDRFAGRSKIGQFFHRRDYELALDFTSAHWETKLNDCQRVMDALATSDVYLSLQDAKRFGLLF